MPRFLCVLCCSILDGPAIYRDEYTLDPRYNVLQCNTVEVIDPDFSGTDQSWISVNRTYMYMYAVVRVTK